MPGRMAEIRPPEQPPTYTAIRKEIPLTGSIPKVKGSMIARAVNAESPGRAPITRPPSTPPMISSIVTGFSMDINPCSNSIWFPFL